MPSTLSASDFKDSTGEFSKYRKILTYKACEAVHTRPPQVARPVYVKCQQMSPGATSWRGMVWTGHICRRKSTRGKQRLRHVSIASANNVTVVRYNP